MKTAAMASSSQPTPSKGPEALRAGDEHHAGEGREGGHVGHDEEVDPLALHTGQLGGVPVATDRVDVTTKDGLAREEAIDDDEEDEDEAGDREALGAGGDEHHHGHDDEADEGQPNPHDHCILDLGPDLDELAAAAQCPVDDRGAADEAQQQGQVVVAGVGAPLRQ